MHQQQQPQPQPRTILKHQPTCANAGEQPAAATQRHDATQSDQQQQDKSSWLYSDDDADIDDDAIVRCARDASTMADSMYQFTRGEGDLNTTQDLFTQAELLADGANELYKEVRCFSYKVSSNKRAICWLAFATYAPSRRYCASKQSAGNLIGMMPQWTWCAHTTGQELGYA